MNPASVRETSKEAYKFIVTQGILGKARAKAYAVLYQHGPLAQFEMEEYESKEKAYGGTLSKCFAELEKSGAIKVIGKRTNPVSKRECNLYDVTSKVIKEPHDSKERPEKKAAALKTFLEELAERHGDRKVSIDKVVGKILTKMTKLKM